MNEDVITVGVLIRVMKDRWDAPTGTIARVETVGQAGVPAAWCFTVEWLTRSAHYGENRYSLNLFEEDLQDILRSIPAPSSSHPIGIPNDDAL